MQVSILTEGLLKRRSRCDRRTLALLSVPIGVGFAVYTGALSCIQARYGQQLVVQEPAVNMAGQYMRLTSRQFLPLPASSRLVRLPGAAATPKDAGAVVASEVATPDSDSITKRRGAIVAVGAAYFAALAYAYENLGFLQPQSFRGDDDLMKKKAHGTCVAPPPSQLRWGADRATADNIACFNRIGAEYRGYFRTTDFLKQESAASGEITFYDSITNKPLFVAPRGRSFEEFVAESNVHGWPSFRDEEVVGENMRILPGGEAVSVDGTHLGHNIPDLKGNRYCIDLVSVAGFGGK